MDQIQAKAPAGLAVGGRDLWKAITDAHELDAGQIVTLLEACRAKDRLDKLDELLRGDVDTWATLHLDPRSVEGNIYELRVTQALVQANSTANLLKQLLAALRLPDAATGRKPQARGGARGAYTPTGKTGTKVSSIDRARARKSG
jgi:hypothetical protein